MAAESEPKKYNFMPQYTTFPFGCENLYVHIYVHIEIKIFINRVVHLRWTVFKACTFWLWWYYYYLKKKSVLSITYHTTNKNLLNWSWRLQFFPISFSLLFLLLCVCSWRGQRTCLQVHCNWMWRTDFNLLCHFPGAVHLAFSDKVSH